MVGRNTAEKKQDFGLMQNTILFVEYPLRAKSRPFFSNFKYAMRVGTLSIELKHCAILLDEKPPHNQ